MTDFHLTVIAAGWRTQFTDATHTYLHPTAQHTLDTYLIVLRDAGFQIQIVPEALVRDVPENSLFAYLIENYDKKTFLLVTDADKPG